MRPQPRPLCILIAALGGEGGGVLSDWLIKAAMIRGLPVQGTSIPGVAQRTGATTYYLEIFPTPLAELGERRPVMALYPGPGHIDLMIASELLEVGRALENGYVSPDRTVLIGSTHRIYAMAEKTAMADERYDAATIVTAAERLAKRALLADLARLAQDNDTAINAVLLGVIAGSGVLPIPSDDFAAAVRRSGIAVEANLRGFQAGLTVSGPDGVTEDAPAAAAVPPPEPQLQAFPAASRSLLGEGRKRLADYQDGDYARLYLQRLEGIAELDLAERGYALTVETARYLALWMSYEDVIRVADLKTRAQRFQRVRREVGAKPHEPLHIHEVLKPGVEEIAAVLPARLGETLSNWAERRKRRWHFAMRIKSHTVFGFSRLWLLARLKPWRRRSYRYRQEQALIERWLDAIRRSAGADYDLALAVAECANLNKGYGETFARGRGHFLRLLEQLIEPALAGDASEEAAARLRLAYRAALADPQGLELGKTLDAVKAQPLRWRSADKPTREETS